MSNVSLDATNLRYHCSHGCRYCNCPALLGLAQNDYFAPGCPRPDVIARLRRDVQGLVLRQGARYLLSVVADPYCPEEQADQTTREAISVLREKGLDVAILSKGGARSLRDLDLLAEGDHLFGVSLVWMSDEKRAWWEPQAASVEDRLHTLAVAREAGLRTWLMLAPIIEPTEALAVIDEVTGRGLADEIWVEGLAQGSPVCADYDVSQFVREATERLHRWEQRTGGYWRIKSPFVEYLQPGGQRGAEAAGVLSGVGVGGRGVGP